MAKHSKVPIERESAEPARTPAPSAWSGFGNLREEMERLFDMFEPRGWFDRGPMAATARPTAGLLRPAIDLTESDGGYALTAELPGLSPENVEVRISDGMLIVRGEKTEETSEEKTDYHMSERRWGSFQRTIRLPTNVDRDGIEARFSNGVLTVRLPKSEAALADEKKIDIKAA